MRIRSNVAQSGAPSIRSTGERRQRRPLGEMLNLDAGHQTAVVNRQSQTGRLFGETAVELGFVTEEQVRRAIEQQQGFSVLSAGDDRVAPLVVSAFNPDDELARMARNLRAAITAAIRGDHQPVHSVALIGCATEAELPVLAANLAVACAQTGVPTLLVDAELDHPHQHALFRVANRAGLTTLLSNTEHGDVTQRAAIDGLSLLTSGPGVPNAPELFDRQRLASVIELFVDDFGLVLVDAGCGVTAAAAALGLDAALIVLRRNTTYMRDVRLLVEQLEANGQIVIGTVIVE